MPVDEKAKELFRAAKRIAHKGEPSIMCNTFHGVLGEERYTVEHNMGSGQDSISIRGPDFGVTLREERYDRDGYSCYVYKGELPDDLIGFLGKLEPDASALAQEREIRMLHRAPAPSGMGDDPIRSRIRRRGEYHDAVKRYAILGGTLIGNLMGVRDPGSWKD